MSSERKDFFVGYLPTPATIKQWYRWLVPTIVVAAAAFGFWLASAQQAAGNGQWAYGDEHSITGRLLATPYPHVITAAGDSVLLVREGKLGVQDWAGEYDQAGVSVTGYPIERGTWKMLELRSSSDISAVITDDIPSVADEIAFGTHTLAGEIVDSKCFLGVMKPGDGHVHRACAELCIRGGLPPMLVATDASGQQAGYLIVSPDGASARDLVAGKIARPVALTGTVTQRGTLRYLRLGADGINVLAALADSTDAELCTL